MNIKLWFRRFLSLFKKKESQGHVAGNFDEFGKDNDGDGRVEEIYVKGSDRARSHYRAKRKD